MEWLWPTEHTENIRNVQNILTEILKGRDRMLDPESIG
jgi:hypothetical protein